ncbi:hypothetical protein [Spirillospora sp. NPDC029432]|uniref:hypothetical protein n=1 Tax=Spirillospora sp. NPDC029432 TaxID=3154599 RepID=UPI003455FA40
MLIDEKDRSRSGYIAGLRMLADLLEQVPEIPYYDHGSIKFALGGSEAEAFAVIERAAAALAAAGIEHGYYANDYSHGVEFVIGGVSYGFSRLRDVALEALYASTSYERNVQVA